VDDGRGDCIEGTAAPPIGRECFRLEFSGDAGSGVQEVCVQIMGVAAPALTLPIGTECIRLDYQSSRGSGTTQTCITVIP
jgi:hypothetical protein